MAKNSPIEMNKLEIWNQTSTLTYII
jgi:hypothetical protein